MTLDETLKQLKALGSAGLRLPLTTGAAQP